MRWLFVVVTLAGCAEAGKAKLGQRPDGGLRLPDSDMQMVWNDAPAQMIDAPQQGGARTLSETTNNTLVANNSIACGSLAGTAQNSYYRVFVLSDFAIT